MCVVSILMCYVYVMCVVSMLKCYVCYTYMCYAFCKYINAILCAEYALSYGILPFLHNTRNNNTNTHNNNTCSYY